MLKSTKKYYGVESIDNWKGKMMWRTLEKCWKCQGFCGDGEEGKSKVSPRNHCKRQLKTLEKCDKTLPRVNLFDELGKPNNGNNWMEANLQEYQIPSWRCSFGFKPTCTTIAILRFSWRSYQSDLKSTK